MPISGPPPPFDWSKIDCAACIDYFTVFCQVKMPLPALDGTANWVRDDSDKTSWNLTVHDPTRGDILAVVSELENPSLKHLELSVDLRPKPDIPIPEKEGLLEQTYRSVAGRFRPEDAAYWGYGTRGGVARRGKPPEQFHTRYPTSDQQLVYGHRNEFMQAKAYLKRTDQAAHLPVEKHVVRMEVHLRRLALMECNLLNLGDMLGYRYRGRFAKHFRIVDRPEIRAKKSRTAAQTAKLRTRMLRAWATAGVGKFAPDLDLPPDTSVTSARQIHARAVRQLSRADFLLKRDQISNAKIGMALRQLERRLRS